MPLYSRNDLRYKVMYFILKKSILTTKFGERRFTTLSDDRKMSKNGEESKAYCHTQ